MKFSIITASFNPGDKLLFTVNSILEQEFQDFEIIVKDGGSKDGALELLKKNAAAGRAIAEGKLRLIIERDRNVYDGMNQALEACRGEYVLFLNCGDRFHDRSVLRAVAGAIGKAAQTVEKQTEKVSSDITGETGDAVEEQYGEKNRPVIYYGNTYCMRTNATVHSAPEITGFTCFRNIPCHQSCFYDRRLFLEKKYDTNLKIRADYDHFLWCYYRGGAGFQYLDFVVADYEGGGISETEKNRKTDKAEHGLVIRRYMKTGEILKYKGIMLLTLAPLRRWIAESSRFSGVYHRIKSCLYRKTNL